VPPRPFPRRPAAGARWSRIGPGLVAALAVAVSGCSATTVMNAATASGAVETNRDIAYGEAPRQALDVYAPKDRAPGRPVIVFFYGGGWDSGSRRDYAWVGQSLALQGYVVVVPDYRLYPQVRWPAFLQDGALAVRWARDHAAALGGDPARLVLMGHSAGAYNAVDLAVDGRWLQAVGMDPHRDIAAVVGLSGPYDFLPLRKPELMTIFGPEASRRDTQPIDHVQGGEPPMLLLTGDRDTTVEPGNSDRMGAALREAGDQVQVIHYAELGHPLTVAALAGPLSWMAPVMRDVTAFIDRTTGWTRRS
jgi:acetyl esterase/lipase